MSIFRQTDRQTEDDPLAVRDYLLLEAFGRLGQIECEILDVPKALTMTERGGGLVRLAIQRMNQCGLEAELELRRLHIPIVNRDYDKYNLYFEVEKAQASWAEYVLHRAGFIVTSVPVDPRNEKWAADQHFAGKGRVPAWGGPRQLPSLQERPNRGIWGCILDWIMKG